MRRFRLSGARLAGVAWLVFAVVFAGQARAQDVDLERLDRAIQEARQDWGVPGLAVAIVKDGEVVLAKGYGARDMHDGGAVDEHTLFAIASNSKAFTAACRSPARSLALPSRKRSRGRSCFSALARSSEKALPESSGLVNSNISTLLNWWPLIIPLSLAR